MNFAVQPARLRLRSVPSTMDHVYRLVPKLLEADLLEVTGAGLDPRRALRLNFREAVFRRTYFVDGQIAAMVGLTGSLIGERGYPYLMTTPMVERTPVAFLKEARSMLQ